MAAKKPFELTPAQQKRFDKCYGVYRKKAARGQDEITWAKYDFDDVMTEKIYEAIIAQNKSDKGETHKKFLRSFSRWMNERGWADEIQSSQEKAFNARSAFACLYCQNEVRFKGGMCGPCETGYKKRSKQEVLDNLKKMGAPAYSGSMEKWSQELREFLNDSGYPMPNAIRRLL